VPIAKSLYSVHPSVAMAQKGFDSLRQKTERSLEDWLTLIKKSGPSTEKERRARLKSEHVTYRIPITSLAEIDNEVKY
jgi:hypothetical protein